MKIKVKDKVVGISHAERGRTMIQDFVNRFMEHKDELESVFAKAHPESYYAIVKAVVSLIANTYEEQGYGQPDPDRIHAIDDGEYQGTLLFVIAAREYQPSDYWYVRVAYGSCSGCDTLESIREYDDDPPSAEQVKDYMELALHIVQGLKALG